MFFLNFFLKFANIRDIRDIREIFAYSRYSRIRDIRDIRDIREYSRIIRYSHANIRDREYLTIRDIRVLANNSRHLY